MSLGRTLKILGLSLGVFTLEAQAFPWEENYQKSPQAIQLQIVSNGAQSDAVKDAENIITLSQDDVNFCLKSSRNAKNLKNCLNQLLINKQ